MARGRFCPKKGTPSTRRGRLCKRPTKIYEAKASKPQGGQIAAPKTTEWLMGPVLLLTGSSDQDLTDGARFRPYRKGSSSGSFATGREGRWTARHHCNSPLPASKNCDGWRTASQTRSGQQDMRSSLSEETALEGPTRSRPQVDTVRGEPGALSSHPSGPRLLEFWRPVLDDGDPQTGSLLRGGAARCMLPRATLRYLQRQEESYRTSARSLELCSLRPCMASRHRKPQRDRRDKWWPGSLRHRTRWKSVVAESSSSDAVAVCPCISRTTRNTPLGNALWILAIARQRLIVVQSVHAKS